MAQDKKLFINKLLDKLKPKILDHKSMIINTDVAQLYVERKHIFLTSPQIDKFNIIIDYYSGERINLKNKTRVFTARVISSFNIIEVNI